MSSPDNAEHASSTTKAAAVRRTGMAFPVDDTPSSILTPLLNMSMGGISSLKGFLPISSPRRKPRPLALDDPFAVWQDGDLGSGRRRLLLLTSPSHALQVFAFTPGTIPDDPHVPETFLPPVEVASIPELRYDDAVERSALPSTSVSRKAIKDERTLSARLLDKALWGQHGPVVALTVVAGPGSSGRTPNGQLALVLVSLNTGKAFRRLELGSGAAAQVSSSARAIIVTTSHPSPSIHVFDRNLHLISNPITDLPVNPRTHLPVASVSGRLLAFTTREAAATPGADGLGSIFAASSTRFRASSTGSAHSPPPQSAQNALLTSAVEIGGGVARGVWAGLKMGARAAGERLAQSAPSESADSLPRAEFEAEGGGPESRSVEEPLTVESIPPPGGVWVKIVDLFARSEEQPVLIAHFRLPPSRTLVSPLPNGQHPRAAAVPREHPVTFISFSPEGSRLFAAAADGRDFHILDVRPDGVMFSKRGPVKGDVWDAYVLRRGHTTADVCAVEWSQDERWISVGTGKGTVHVFPISPAGGKPSATSHVPVKFPNPEQMTPLSVDVAPFARLRPQRNPSSDDLAGKAEEALPAYAVASFGASRRHPTVKGTLCQDVLIYRPGTGQMELARLTVHAATPPTATPVSHAPPSGRRRSSNLTEMMREKAGLRPESDLAVEQALKARWALPLEPQHGVTTKPLAPKPAAAQSQPVRSLYHAEIRTHSSNPRILPASIYLSRQIEFFAATPTDDFSPLSVLDKLARTGRLVFRPEVEVRPTADARSFDEPLNSALHSVIQSGFATQIPQLPNGSPLNPSRWPTVPIWNVAANLGEGVGRVRREVARAQHSRLRRRKSNAAGDDGLSFEDDTVFAPRPATDESDELESSPSSLLPTNTDSSNADDDDEWGDKWEDEYRKAVEDDGPDDLVLGLLDEEEDERRKWEARQKVLATEYQKSETKQHSSNNNKT